MRDSLTTLLSPEDLLAGARFLRRLPSFLRRPISFQEALTTLRRRLERREVDFLALVKRAVYAHPISPYRSLLAQAGCEYGDLETLVAENGVEGALRILFRHGVYLTVDELKGRRPVVRDSVTTAVDPSRLRNPEAAYHVLVQSSGSGGPATPVGIDLACLRDVSVNFCLVFSVLGGGEWRHAIWGVPGGAAVNQLLRFAGFGARPVRWFSQIDPAVRGLHPRYRWSARLIRWGSLLAGVPLPRPIHVPISDPLPIAHWMTEVLRLGAVPHVSTFASSAVRLCQAAQAAGLDLRGAHLTLSGEPTTEARLAAVRQAGVRPVPQYGSSEAGGTIGHGCLAPEAADELHLFHDLRAVIQPGTDGAAAGLPPTALLFSSLRRTAPLILLNVSLGDLAVLGRRSCGCPLERLGWTTHLHTIRSYEKFTAGGMTFLDTDIIRVLEEVLPARFGGAPTDYQLVEDEAGDGRPRLRLLVHPAVGPVDCQGVKEAFVNAISRGDGVERVMGLAWQAAGFLRVERRVPECTTGGKILHLHAHPRSPLPPSSSREAPSPFPTGSSPRRSVVPGAQTGGRDASESDRMPR